MIRSGTSYHNSRGPRDTPGTIDECLNQTKLEVFGTEIFIYFSSRYSGSQRISAHEEIFCEKTVSSCIFDMAGPALPIKNYSSKSCLDAFVKERAAASLNFYHLIYISGYSPLSLGLQ